MVWRGDRVRIGEWLMGGGALVLLLSEFVLKWYGLQGIFLAHFGAAAFSVDAWHSLAVLRWLMLLVSLAGLAAWWAQGARRSPAVPISLTVMLFPCALLTTLLLLDRVVFSLPLSHVSIRAGAVVGLLAAVTLTAGSYVSMRMDGIRAQDGPGEVETIRLTGEAR